MSLRDIERAMIVLEWFHSVLDHIEEDNLYEDIKLVHNCFSVMYILKYLIFCFAQKCDRHTRALILTIAVCYYANLQCRENFEKFIAPQLIRNALDASRMFKEEITRYFIF